MPVTLKGSCHCRQVKFELESNTPVPYMLCQCSICRKVGGYMGSCNIMGNTKTLKIITGKDKIKTYQAVMEFNADDTPKKRANGIRSFCSECSSMLWNYDEEWADWIYPFASVIDSPNPLPNIPGYPTFTMSSPTTNAAGARVGKSDDADKPELYTIMRTSCPDHVPVPQETAVFSKYAPGSIENWHKATGTWVD